MPIYAFGYSAAAQTANGGSVSWTLGPLTGASTGRTTMPGTAGAISYALTSYTGDETPIVSIPSGAEILGLALRVFAYAGAANTLEDYTAQVLKNGVPCANRATGSFIGTADQVTVYGGPTDLWGATWGPSDIADLNFLFQVQNAAGTACEISVDGVGFYVYTSGAGGSGPIAHSLPARLRVFPSIGKTIL